MRHIGIDNISRDVRVMLVMAGMRMVMVSEGSRNKLGRFGGAGNRHGRDLDHGPNRK